MQIEGHNNVRDQIHSRKLNRQPGLLSRPFLSFIGKQSQRGPRLRCFSADALWYDMIWTNCTIHWPRGSLLNVCCAIVLTVILGCNYTTCLYGACAGMWAVVYLGRLPGVQECPVTWSWLSGDLFVDSGDFCWSSKTPWSSSEWCACNWVNKCYEWVYNLLLYYCVSGIRNIWRFVNRASLSALSSERCIFVTFCFCHCSQDSLITELTHSPVGLCEFVKRISNCFIPIKRTNVYIFSFQNSRNFLVLIV